MCVLNCMGVYCYEIAEQRNGLLFAHHRRDPINGYDRAHWARQLKNNIARNGRCRYRHRRSIGDTISERTCGYTLVGYFYALHFRLSVRARSLIVAI